MSDLNWPRILAGGLVTGLIINVGETLLNGFILVDSYAGAMMRYGVAESPHSVAIFTVYGFLLGVVIVFLYAALRPGLGSGPGTAVLTGLVVWFLFSVSFADFHLAIPVFPTRVPIGNALWGLVEVPLATLAGAAVYRDRAPQPRPVTP